MSRPVDVEGAFVELLEDASTKVPNPRPVGFTRVTRAGGDRVNVGQSRVRLLVESWDVNSLAAFDRSADAWEAISGTQQTQVGDVWVSRVELTEPVNFPDDDLPRYQFVAQLTVALGG